MYIPTINVNTPVQQQQQQGMYSMNQNSNKAGETPLTPSSNQTTNVNNGSATKERKRKRKNNEQNANLQVPNQLQSAGNQNTDIPNKNFKWDYNNQMQTSANIKKQLQMNNSPGKPYQNQNGQSNPTNQQMYSSSSIHNQQQQQHSQSPSPLHFSSTNNSNNNNYVQQQQQMNYIASSPKHNHHPNLASPVNYISPANFGPMGSQTGNMSMNQMTGGSASIGGLGSDSGSNSNLSYPPNIVNYITNNNVTATACTNPNSMNSIIIKCSKYVQVSIRTSFFFL